MFTMSSNLAMLDCWLLYSKAKLVVIQYFFQTSFKMFINALLYLTSRYSCSENSEPRRNRESGNLTMGTTNLINISKLADMKTPSRPSIKYIVQVIMTSNYLGMCGHVDAASVLVGHLALLLRHLMLFISIIFVVRFFFLIIIITTMQYLFATSGGISWSTPMWLP